MECFDGAQWPHRDLRSRALRGVSLCGANLYDCLLDDVDLRGTDLYAANLAVASLRRADLRGARLTCASFAGADLRGARLAGAEVVFSDFGGAHLACVDLGRPRAHPIYAEAARKGCPSFADAMRCSPLQASGLRAGSALLAVDAALDTSPDVRAETVALLRSEDWRWFGLGVMAAVRLHLALELEPLLAARLERGEVGASACVALLRAGCAPEPLASRRPDLCEVGRGDGPYRDRVRWGPKVSRRLASIDAWPAPDARPNPASSR